MKTPRGKRLPITVRVHVGKSCCDCGRVEIHSEQSAGVSRDKRIVALYKQHSPISTICGRFGVSRPTVYNALKRAGVKPGRKWNDHGSDDHRVGRELGISADDVQFTCGHGTAEITVSVNVSLPEELWGDTELQQPTRTQEIEA